VKAICKQVDECGSAMERKPNNCRPKTAQTEENVRQLGAVEQWKSNIDFDAAPLHQIFS